MAEELEQAQQEAAGCREKLDEALAASDSRDAHIHELERTVTELQVAAEEGVPPINCRQHLEVGGGWLRTAFTRVADTCASIPPRVACAINEHQSQTSGSSARGFDELRDEETLGERET